MMEISAILNTLSELVIAILPVLAVFQLRVDPRQRWSVIGLLSLGFLVAFAGCFRTYYLYKTVGTYDLTWWSTPHWICSEVEIDTALVSYSQVGISGPANSNASLQTCACAASLRPLIGYMYRKCKGLSTEIQRTPSLESKPPRSVKSNVPTTVSTELSSVGNDHEGQTSWTSLMSRTIDLEGLGVDGFGYRVTITGPPRPKGLLRRGMSKAQRVRQSKQSRNAESAGDGEIIDQVVMETTFEVTEVFQDRNITQKFQRRDPSFQRQSHDDVEDSIERSANGLMDWSLLDTPEVVTALPEMQRGSSIDAEGRRSSNLEMASEAISEMPTAPAPAAISHETSRGVGSLTRLLSVKR
jgi:hypothetical protein